MNKYIIVYRESIGDNWVQWYIYVGGFKSSEEAGVDMVKLSRNYPDLQWNIMECKPMM